MTRPSKQLIDKWEAILAGKSVKKKAHSPTRKYYVSEHDGTYGITKRKYCHKTLNNNVGPFFKKEAIEYANKKRQ